MTTDPAKTTAVDDSCPMCEPGKCPGGAHRNALAEDGIHTREQYAALKTGAVDDARKWAVGDTFTSEYFPSGVAEIVDGSGYVVAYVPLHIGSSRNAERQHWPKRIADAEAQLSEQRTTIERLELQIEAASVAFLDISEEVGFPIPDGQQKISLPLLVNQVVGRVEEFRVQVSELEAQLQAYKVRGDGHAETLRAIAKMEPDAQRMRQWAKDGLSGYTEPIESTLLKLTNDLRQAEAQLRQQKWVCFHCGFEATTEEDATAHFGERDDPQEFTPTCKWWQRMGADERLEAFQDLQKDFNAEQKENGTLEAQLRQEREAKDAAYKEIDRLGDILRSENRLANKSGWDQLRAEIVRLQTTISHAREFLEAIVIAFKEPDGGPYFKLRAFAEKQGIYADDLGRDRVMLRIAQAALANITQKPEEEAKP